MGLSPESFRSALAETGVVAILRGLPTDAVLGAAAALHAGGVRILEVTLDSPDALDSIERIAHAAHDGLLVGAGTVLRPEQADVAAAAGATFLVSPNTDPAVIARAVERGLPALPGAMTPTEIAAAAAAGATAVKVFPADVLGPAYLAAVRAPLREIPLVATGGIDAGNVAAFRAAGALAVGVGGWLTAAGDAAEIRRRAELLLAPPAAS